MNIVEHNDSLATKELSEIERYLMRVIRRYFDMFNIDNKNSVEAIVVESLTRMKREIMHEKSFVFSINGKAGNINLTISDIDGEPAFNKNTAFNKDFASAGDDVPDTICEGNDPRLTDAREPNQHNHQSYDNFTDNNGNTLDYILSQAKFASGTTVHSHLNYHSVLKKLRYTGNRTEIDLAYLEIVKKSLMAKRDDINAIYENIPKQISDALSVLDQAVERSQEYLDYAIRLSKKPPGWYDDAITYTDDVVKRIEKHRLDTIDSVVTKEELSAFLTRLRDYVHSCSSKTMLEDIPLGSSGFVISGTRIYMRHVTPLEIPEGSGPIVRIDSYFKYDTIDLNSKDNIVWKTVSIPLPFISRELDKTYISIRPIFDSDGSAYIETEVVSYMPFYGAKNYNGIRMIYEQKMPTSLTEAYSYARKNNCNLCIFDSQDKIDFVMKNFSVDSEHFINGNGNYDAEDMGGNPITGVWTWNRIDESIPMTFAKWSEGYPISDPYTTHSIYLCPDGTMKTSRVSRGIEKPFFYEYIPRTVGDYYKNPRICYQVFVGKGGPNGTDS